MMSSSKTHLVLALLFLLACCAGYGSWYAVLSGRSAEAADLAQQIQSKDEDAARLKAAKTALASIQSDEALIGNYFVSTSDVVPFLEGLQATGSHLGANVVIASVSADTLAGRPTLALTLQITGSFDAVLRTLGRVEYAPYFVSVSDLSLTTVPATVASANAPTTLAGWAATASLIVGAKSAASSTPAVPSAATSTPSTATP